MTIIEKAKEDLTKIANEKGYWGFIDYLDDYENGAGGIVTYYQQDYLNENNENEFSGIEVSLVDNGFVGSFLFGVGNDNTLKEVI